MNFSNYDANMYYMDQNWEIFVLMLYVNDLFVTGSSEN